MFFPSVSPLTAIIHREVFTDGATSVEVDGTVFGDAVKLSKNINDLHVIFRVLKNTHSSVLFRFSFENCKCAFCVEQLLFTLGRY